MRSPPTQHRLAHDEGLVTWLQVGEGPAALLVHSSGLGARQWGPCMSWLGRRYEVRAPNLSGYGESGPWRGGGLEEDVALLRPLLDRPTVLLGHSYGGVVAMKLAAERPELVSRLVLYEPPLFELLRVTADEEGLAEIAGLELDAELLATVDASPTWVSGFVDYWNGAGYWNHLLEEQQRGLLELAPKVLAEVRSVAFPPPGAQPWEGIECPTLLAYGSKTTAVGRRVSLRLQEMLPDSRLEVLEGEGHMAPVIRARRFLEVVDAFLGA